MYSITGTERRVPLFTTHSDSINKRDEKIFIDSTLPCLVKQFYSKFGQKFEIKTNPHSDAAQKESIEWFKRLSILSGKHLEKLEKYNLGAFLGGSYPKADLKTLEDIVKFGGALYVYDDTIEAFKDPSKVEWHHTRLLSQLKNESSLEENDLSVIKGFDDIWLRLREKTLPIWQTRFTKEIEKYCSATIFESTRRESACIPTLKEYEGMRLSTSATLVMFCFVDQDPKYTLPEEVFNAPYIQNINFLGGHLVNLHNDLVSAQRELGQGEYFNYIPIIQKQYGYSYELSTQVLTKFFERTLNEFQVLESAIPDFGKNQHRVEHYVEGVRDWVSGYIHWAKHSERYRQIEKSKL